MNKRKISTIAIVILSVVVVGLGATLAITYSARYEEGVKVGQNKQIESLKGDKNRGIVPDLVGQNANQLGSWTWGGDMHAKINQNISIPVKFKAPDGEEVTEDNAKNYKVVSQEPKANTVFDIKYKVGEDGYVYDNILQSSGVENIIVTLEKIK